MIAGKRSRMFYNNNNVMAATFNVSQFAGLSSKYWQHLENPSRSSPSTLPLRDHDVIQKGWKFINGDDACRDQLHECCQAQGLDTPANLGEKSASDAEAFRQEGNALFQKKQYRAALECYTQSVQTSPNGESSETRSLALAHANRSAALYHLNHHKACIQDIDEALRRGYPADKHIKVLQRKGQCFMKLGCYSKAKQEFSKALSCIPEQSVGSDKKREEISTLLQQCTKASYILDFEPPYTSLSEMQDQGIAEKSAQLPCASAAVLLKHGEGKGRYLQAGRGIDAGELVIRERPFAAVVLKEEAKIHCHHCFTYCLAPIPCSTCVHARYCSRECRTAAWKEYHGVECGSWCLLQQVNDFSRLSLRILIKAGKSALSDHIARIVQHSAPGPIPVPVPPPATALDPNPVPTSVSGDEESKVDQACEEASLAPTLLSSKVSTSSSSANHDDPGAGCHGEGYDAVLLLEAHWRNHSKNELSDLATTAILLAKCFYQKIVLPETIATLSEDALITSMASLLLLHCRQLKTNSHAVTEVRSSDVGNQTGKSSGGTVQETLQVRVATAVYPTVSLMNHACDPNTIVSFEKGAICVRATKKICEGEEIQHCYGPHARHMTTADRQRALQDQYCFTCECPACTAPSHPPAQQGDGCYRCPHCGGPVNAKGRPATTGPVLCKDEHCGKEVDLQELLEEQEKAVILLSKLNEIYARVGRDKGLMDDLISKTVSIVAALEQLLLPPHPHLAIAYDFMAKCYAGLGDFQKAGVYLSKSVPMVKQQFGPDSIELAQELLKLAQVYFNGKESKSALATINRAIPLFALHYGNRNEDVMELLEMKTCLMSLES